MRSLFVAALLFCSPAMAQQTLFNVPSTQETVPGRLFGQVQIGATGAVGEINTTLELGLLPWLEVGFNLLRMQLYRFDALNANGPATAATLLNANVYFELKRFLALEVGGQGGVGLMPGTQTLVPVIYGWATLRFEAPDRFGSYVVGAYLGNRGALGHGPPAGGLFGLEVPIWEDHVHAQADWVIGLNDLSVIVVGAVIYIGKNFQLSLGGQLPSPGSGNHFGGVLELTYVPTPPAPGEDIGHPTDRPQQPKRQEL